MSETNKAITERWLNEIWNKGDMSALPQLVSEDFVFHGFGGDVRGHEGLKERMAFLGEAFPDGRLTNDETIAKGDKVVYRFTFEGTHKAEFFGVTATGKRVAFEGITILRIAGGKVAEHWGCFDLTGVLQQFGKAFP